MQLESRSGAFPDGGVRISVAEEANDRVIDVGRALVARFLNRRGSSFAGNNKHDTADDDRHPDENVQGDRLSHDEPSERQRRQVDGGAWSPQNIGALPGAIHVGGVGDQ